MSRMLEKKIFQNEKLGLLPDYMFKLYVGLIVYSDNGGRLKGDVKYLKTIIFPYDKKITPAKIKGALKVLVREKLIYYYEVKGEWYIEHPKWTQYQTLRSYDSKLPGLEKEKEERGGVREEEDGIKKKPAEDIPDPNVKLLIQRFIEKFKEACKGEEPMVQWVKDSFLIKELLKIYPYEKLCALQDIFFKNKFYKKLGFTIGVFYKNIQSMLIEWAENQPRVVEQPPVVRVKTEPVHIAGTLATVVENMVKKMTGPQVPMGKCKACKKEVAQQFLDGCKGLCAKCFLEQRRNEK